MARGESVEVGEGGKGLEGYEGVKCGEGDEGGEGGEGVEGGLREMMVMTLVREERALREVSYCGLFDGHNGAKAAELAAGRLHNMLAAEDNFRTSGESGADEEVMRQAFERAFLNFDRALLDQFKLEGSTDGSTGLVVLRLGGVLYSAHVGDSRAVLCRGGLAERLTDDHKPDRADEKERVYAAGGSVEFAGCWRVVCQPRSGNVGRALALAVSRSFGDPDFKTPHPLVEATPTVTRTELTPAASFAILASDGLWDVLSDQEAVDIVKEHVSEWKQTHPRGSGKQMGMEMEKAAADKLVEGSLKAGTQDNVTAVVMFLPWD
ncbi:hypothetical protein CYMTET_53599 [Cymbomonas tetramitiformis]|uniref:PPM-type phosphatase domain-containing protein n=1 Tax=Cymbomonas tetramitiformis TaxID=36881 RepID=A0AAE0BIE1_9CHLO|nr:hypothetical protein CYMTET_53599 [Cymbomonas tetramitiformis]